MMWKTYKLGEVTSWKSGGTPSKQKDEYWNGDIPWVSAKSFTTNNISDSDTKITEAGLKVGSKLAKTDSILLLVRGSGLFNRLPVGIVTKPVAFNQDIKSIEVNDKIILPRFLLYWFEASRVLLYSKLEETGIGAGKFDTEILKNLSVEIPSLDYQQILADFFKSLDGKIELNRRMNQTLEAIAQTLFKEWFVNFNFPDENGQPYRDSGGKLIDSELGPIPKGWRVGKIGDVYKTTSGGTPSRTKNEYYEYGTIDWVKSKELNDTFILNTEEKISELGLKNSSAKLLPKHSVLVAMYGATVGQIGILANTATCNQAICAIIPSVEYPYTFILQHLKLNKEELINKAVGSAQQNISQDLIQKERLIIPDKENLTYFHQVVDPIFEHIKKNLQQAKSLTQLRDSILPKLMRGELLVPQAEELVEETLSLAAEPPSVYGDLPLFRPS